jgi:hypothetical protein
VAVACDAWRQCDLGLGLSGAEAEMIEVAWDGLVQIRQLCVDQEMVVGLFDAAAGGAKLQLTRKSAQWPLPRL